MVKDNTDYIGDMDDDVIRNKTRRAFELMTKERFLSRVSQLKDLSLPDIRKPRHVPRATVRLRRRSCAACLRRERDAPPSPRGRPPVPPRTRRAVCVATNPPSSRGSVGGRTAGLLTRGALPHRLPSPEASGVSARKRLPSQRRDRPGLAPAFPNRSPYVER